jgi:NAD+ synthase (glutamine-hydrolysing)
MTPRDNAPVESSARRLRIALAQINPVVGDLGGNTALIARWIANARDAGASVVVVPELALTGYPPEDLLLKRHFRDAAARQTELLAESVEGIVALVGAPEQTEDELFNALYVMADGRVQAIYRKVRLPNYGVFDERRYFSSGEVPGLIHIDDLVIGLTVCEDVWLPGHPTSSAAEAGADLIVNASASPYHRGKGAAREAMVAERARENDVPMALCNCVGGQDELVFDGHSFVVDAEGRTLARAAQFEPELLVCDLELPRRQTVAPDEAAPVPILLDAERPTAALDPGPPVPRRLAPPLADVEEVYRALCTGLADYIAKNRFNGVVLGLSGGIDSALVALLAADVIDPADVHCVVMPSPHSSEGTQSDARRIGLNLGATLIEIPIEGAMEAFAESLATSFDGTEPGVAEENIQSRIRGTLVMALSNKFGWLPLATGNKSEMSVGYATLYGDMAGGFAVIKDVPKTLVYELVEYRNGASERELIPASAIERAPSAELRPDQFDTDSLPPYETLDAALAEYVERDGGLDSMLAMGIDREVAERVISLVDRAEYKRRQAPPGVKITPKAFGRDRRMPITNRFGG